MQKIIVIKILSFAKKIFFYFIVSSFAFSQSISITKPNNKQKIKPGDLLEISWHSESLKSFQDKVTISYSNNGSNWNDITRTGVKENSYFWFIPDNIKDDDGTIYLKLSVNKYIYDDLSLKLDGVDINELYLTGSSPKQNSTPTKKTQSNSSVSPPNNALFECCAGYGCLYIMYLVIASIF